MTYIAIDPGANGCMCVLTATPIFIDFKTQGLATYANTIRSLQETNTDFTIVVEQVSSRTAQGVKSVFSFGQRLGEIEGMLITLNLPWATVTPQKWQKFCGVIPKSGKPGIYTAISEIYPDALLLGPKGGIRDGRCDALSMAHFLKETNA